MFNNIQKGDFIKCISDNLNSFSKGKCYSVVRGFHVDIYMDKVIIVIDDNQEEHYLSEEFLQNSFVEIK